MAQTSREKGMGSAWLLPVLEAQSTDVLVPTHGPSCPRLGRMPYALFLANGPSSCLACYHVGTMEVLVLASQLSLPGYRQLSPQRHLTKSWPGRVEGMQWSAVDLWHARNTAAWVGTVHAEKVQVAFAKAASQFHSCSLPSFKMGLSSLKYIHHICPPSPSPFTLPPSPCTHPPAEPVSPSCPSFFKCKLIVRCDFATVLHTHTYISYFPVLLALFFFFLVLGFELRATP
jgi:hypothetical protein